MILASNGVKTLVFDTFTDKATLTIKDFLSAERPIPGVCLEIITMPMAEGGTNSAVLCPMNTGDAPDLPGQGGLIFALPKDLVWIKEVSHECELYKKVRPEEAASVSAAEPVAEPVAEPAPKPNLEEKRAAIKALLSLLTPEEVQEALKK